MQFSPRRDDPLFDSLQEVVRGLGMSLVELSVSRHKGSVRIHAAVYRKGIVGVADCSKVHHAILPRLELAFPDQDLYVEVASPGIDRTIKDAAEFPLYVGRGVRCFRHDTSDWTAGVVVEADENRVVLRGASGLVELPYAVVAKAKLDYSQEVED